MGTEGNRQFSLAWLIGFTAAAAVTFGVLRLAATCEDIDSAFGLFIVGACLVGTTSGTVVGFLIGGQRGAMVGMVCSLVATASAALMVYVLVTNITWTL